METNKIHRKILNQDTLTQLTIGRIHPLIWTNGCFDLIHSGHIQYLYECKKLGGDLIIGINTDDSVRRLKGEKRPILPLPERMEHLAAFFFVDYVFPYEEDDPLRWIRFLRPDYLVKGGDYQADEIIGYKEVTEYGGKVLTIPLTKGKSTTSLIDKILQQYG